MKNPMQDLLRMLADAGSPSVQVPQKFVDELNTHGEVLSREEFLQELNRRQEPERRNL